MMTGNCVLVTAPAEEPLTLAEVRAHCKVDHTTEDSDLTGWLKDGREDFEDVTNRAVITSTWDYSCEWFPCETEIRLPKGQLQTVTSVTYYGADDTPYTLSSSDYYVDTAPLLGRIVLKYDKSWPMTSRRPYNGVVVRFVAGWANRAAVPEGVKSYVRLFAGHRYAHREGVIMLARESQESKELAVALSRISGRYRINHY